MSDTTELWLVRHGQTDWNLQGRYQGNTDLPLNAAGLAQALALAELIEGERIQAIYSSDLQRAYRTAQAVADRWQLPIHTEPRLREVRLGEWEGLLFSEIQQRYASNWAEREVNPLFARPVGGESVYDLAQRAWPAVDEIAAANQPGPVLLVAHGLVLATLLCAATNTPLSQTYQNVPENAAVTIVHWPTHSARLLAELAPAPDMAHTR